ncbi:MAG: hypothetical protein E7534_03140 [Ruminococcaceae bacterium]|nr:hypothetical protein [Oscillospiraceae bacterium]
MFDYTISREASNTAFKKACATIETNIMGLHKNELLIDVDGTLIQIYRLENKKIKIINDYEVDAVYVESEVNLETLFTNEL